MAKFDAIQFIEEKREIDRILSIDADLIQDVVSRFQDADEELKDNPVLHDFFVMGWFVMEILHQFVHPAYSLLYRFNQKYPHATFISTYKDAITNPQRYRDIKCAREDELYDVLQGMKIAYALEILSWLDNTESQLKQLINALATEDKKEFINQLSNRNLPPLFLKSISVGRVINDNLASAYSFIVAQKDDKINDEEYKFGVTQTSVQNSNEVFDSSKENRERDKEDITGSDVTNSDIVNDYIPNLYSRTYEMIDLLLEPINDQTEGIILEKDFSINDWEEVLYLLIGNICELSRFLYQYLTNYERKALDTLFQREGVLRISQMKDDEGNIEQITLRTYLDTILKEMPYNKPIEVKEYFDGSISGTSTSKSENNANQSSSSSSSSSISLSSSNVFNFAHNFLTPKPNLTYSAILKIAQDLTGQTIGSSIKKAFISQEDVNTFCWFFNEGSSVKEIDFTKRIQWNSTADSLKLLIMLIRGARNNMELSETKLIEGDAQNVVSVFEYRYQRRPRNFNLDGRKKYFLKNSSINNVSKEDKNILIDIIRRNVPWKLNF